jgi:hypothetical protein
MTRSASIPSIAADGGSPGRSGPRAANRIPWRSALSALALLGLVGTGVAAYWSVPPAPFDVAEVAETLPRQPGQDPVPGSHGVAAAIRIGETLLGKPGGFLYNDRLPPGALLDNTPSWECGTLMALRDYTRALRNDFSRSQTQSIENTDVKQADLRFAIDPKSWALPEAETEYALGIDALEQYLAHLTKGDDPNAQFFARADNLAAYLAVVEKRLGNFGVRLTSSVSDSDLAAVIAMPVPDEDPATRNDLAPTRTDWDQIDNVFYCARGYGWAILHLTQTIERDFSRVLEAKRGETSMQQIIRDLKGATKPMASPIVLNGDGYGILANHSLVLASYIAKANAALMDLRILLQEG